MNKNEKLMTVELSNKVMTVREVAEAMGVSKDTVLNCIKRIMPNILQHGKTTFLTETQVSLISKELKSNNTVTDRLTVEVSSTVKNTTTELEVLSNALSAFNALQDLYNQKEAEYKNIIAEKQAILDRITNGKGCYSISQTAKALKLPYGNITLFEKLRNMQILNQDNTTKQEQINNGNFKVIVKYINEKVGNKTVTLTTGKGLVYLAKKFNTEIDESVKADA